MLDRKLAKQWYNLAAEQGHEDARASLEQMRWDNEPKVGGVNDNKCDHCFDCFCLDKPCRQLAEGPKNLAPRLVRTPCLQISTH